MKDAVIIVLAVAVVFLSYRLATVENQRYAAVLNMCPSKILAGSQDPICLSKIETRTPWLWNLIYGLRG